MSVIASTVARSVGLNVSPSEFSLEPREEGAEVDEMAERLKAALGAVEP